MLRDDFLIMASASRANGKSYPETKKSFQELLTDVWETDCFELIDIVSRGSEAKNRKLGVDSYLWVYNRLNRSSELFSDYIEMINSTGTANLNMQDRKALASILFDDGSVIAEAYLSNRITYRKDELAKKITVRVEQVDEALGIRKKIAENISNYTPTDDTGATYKKILDLVSKSKMFFDIDLLNKFNDFSNKVKSA